jgi:hypothetical protein
MVRARSREIAKRATLATLAKRARDERTRDGD